MTTDHQKLSILLFLQEKIFSEGYDVLGAARENAIFASTRPCHGLFDSSACMTTRWPKTVLLFIFYEKYLTIMTS